MYLSSIAHRKYLNVLMFVFFVGSSIDSSWAIFNFFYIGFIAFAIYAHRRANSDRYDYIKPNGS